MKRTILIENLCVTRLAFTPQEYHSRNIAKANYDIKWFYDFF